MKRMGMMIGLDSAQAAEYRRLHADVWPDVLAQLSRSNVRNYTIFWNEAEATLFGYWEYHGTDFDADMKKMADDPTTQKWWAICGPMQRPLESRAEGEHWADMQEVFHMD